MPDDPISSSRTTAAPLTGNVGATAATTAIRIEEPSWLDALPYLNTLSAEVCADVLERVLGKSAEAWPEVSLVFADDVFVRNLNADYRGKDAATNVLSFPSHEFADDEGDGPPDATGEYLLGDVVLALETVRNEATTQGKALADHVAHLIVHGVLHLLGYDHANEDEAVPMEALEIEILTGLGIRNPYLYLGDKDDDEVSTDAGGRAHV